MTPRGSRQSASNPIRTTCSQAGSKPRMSSTHPRASTPGRTCVSIGTWRARRRRRDKRLDRDADDLQLGSDRQRDDRRAPGLLVGTTTGTAWFDDLRVTEILSTDPHPRWKLLVLVYETTDFTYIDGTAARHVVGQIGQAQIAAAAAAATRFVLTDIPLLTSGNMVPEVTVRYPGTLTRLSQNGVGWWPSPEDTALERDPAFDGVVVIWQPTVTDQDTGEALWIGSAAGLTPGMGWPDVHNAYHRGGDVIRPLNVFKHEWGHSILVYFDAAGTAPKPTVSNHAESTTYVNCQTGRYYVWVDETDANLIPNSIYNNDSGFTHDYYSGTTALATNPTTVSEFQPLAWATDGPVSKALIDLTTSDATPPITIATVSPPPNSAGWNNSDVTVGLTSVDGGGGSRG